MIKSLFSVAQLHFVEDHFISSLVTVATILKSILFWRFADKRSWSKLL